MGIQIINPVSGGAIDLTAPPTNIGTVTPPAITVSTLFRSANSGNVPFIAQPLGTGAFQLQQTDNTAVGGNARGANAIDLQTSRAQPEHVASGISSFVVGYRNTASATGSSTIGYFNLASGSFSLAACALNTASGSASVALGNVTTASGDNSTSLGSHSTTKSVAGLLALGSAAIIATTGKTQLNQLVLGVATTDATPAVLRSNTSAAGSTNQLVLQNNSALYVEGLVIANVTGAGDTSSWKIAATIKRGANAASTVLVGSPTVTMAHQNAGASTWVVAVTANTTNGTLAVTVTGQAATTIRWTCTLFASEVAF